MTQQNIHHFNHTVYCLFDVNCTNFNQIYSLFSQMWKFKNYQFKSQVASTGNWFPFVLAVVDRVINETNADDRISLITVLQCNVYLALKF